MGLEVVDVGEVLGPTGEQCSPLRHSVLPVGDTEGWAGTKAMCSEGRGHECKVLNRVMILVFGDSMERSVEDEEG